MLFKGNSSRLEFLIEKIQAHKESPSPLPDDKCNLKAKEGLLTNGTFAWRCNEDESIICQRGGGTPSSCTTSTSMSFASEPDVDVDLRMTVDTNNPTGPYPCQFCDKTFPSLSYLKKHEQTHGDHMPYRCSWCARLFKHKRSRDRHVKLHTGDRRYRCTQCEAAFSRSDHLKIHMKTHDNQKPYHCSECSRGYNTAAALTSHMQSHKRPQSTNQYAKSVPEDRRSSSSWHSRSTVSSPNVVVNSPLPTILTAAAAAAAATLSQKISYSPEPAEITPGASFLRSSLTLACMYCTRDTFTSMEQLQLHVRATHETILNGDSPSTSPVATAGAVVGRRRRRKREFQLKSADKSDTNSESLSCRQCTMKFTKLTSLRDHLATEHRDDLPSSLSCPLCGIPCSSAAHYAEHYVLEHCENDTNETKYPRSSAELTSIEAQSVATVQNHVNGTTTSTDNYSSSTLLCGQCGAALKDFESFRIHVARHLQANHQQKYQSIRCPKCELTFQARDDMLSHLIKHFLDQTVKQYSCETCDNYFDDSASLEKHFMESHAQHLYRCALCRDTFDSSVAIQMHFSVKHTNEATVYHCSDCMNSKNQVMRNSSSSSTLDDDTECIFRNVKEMMEHVVKIHAPMYTNQELSSPGNAVSTPGVIGELFRCCFCGIYCTSDKDLQQHHLTSHSTCLYRCPICREGFTVEFLLDKHIAHSHNVVDNDNDEKNYTRLKSPDALPRKRRHSPDLSGNLNEPDNTKRSIFRPITTLTSSQRCELCERSDFSSEAELRAHKKLTHKSTSSKLTTKPSLSLQHHLCNYCGETLRSRVELEAHTRLHHTPNDPGKRYKCNICDEVFSTGGILAEHKLQQHCKIKLSNNCIVCRGKLTSEMEFLQHIQKHSHETIDAQHHTRLDNLLSYIPAHCVVCRQTLISELECQLHAKYHLQSNNGNNSSDEKSNCCICLREIVHDSVNLSSTDEQLKVCQRCYQRHTQGLPILGTFYDNIQKWNEKFPTHTNNNDDDEYEKSNHESNEYNVKSIKFEGNDDDIGSMVDEKMCETFENHHLHHEEENASGARPYDCSHCALKFSFPAELERHLTTIHSNKNANVAAQEKSVVVIVGQSPEDNSSLDNVIVKEEIIVNAEESEEMSNDNNDTEQLDYD